MNSGNLTESKNSIHNILSILRQQCISQVGKNCVFLVPDLTEYKKTFIVYRMMINKP